MTKTRALFPALPTVYLKTLGELLICGTRLQVLLDSDAAVSDAWRERADRLVEEAMKIGDAISRVDGPQVARATMTDGSTIVADLEYLDSLVRKMHRHQSLGVLQSSPSGDRGLVAS